MSKKRLPSLALFALLLALVLVACRKEEPTPTPEAEISTPSAAVTPTAPAVSELSYDWPPQVVYASPAQGEEAPLDGPITVRFDQPMDQASVEQAFAVSQLGGGAVQGALAWPRPDTVVFTPSEVLERAQEYEVQIDQTAEADNGQALREEVQFQVQTVGFLQVTDTVPGDGGREIETDAAITVVFNRPVVPLVATGQQADLPQPLTFEPAVEGEGKWVSTSIYRFEPSTPLAGATDYTVSVDAGLEDVTGGLLPEAYVWTFRTLRPQVVETAPDNGAVSVVPTNPITVTFNMPMDEASTEAATSLSPGAAVSTEWLEDGRVMVLTPSDMLELETDYTLTIGAAARSASGQATLERDKEVDFSTVPLPAVISTDPANGAEAFRFQGGFNVQFASPMDWSTIEDQLIIEPAPADDVMVGWDDVNAVLWTNFELERDTQYTITIPGSAADPYGNTLGEDYTWSFTTPALDPMVSLNLPQWYSMLSTSYPTAVDIIYRNVSRIDAELYSLGLPINRLSDYFDIANYAPSGEPIQSWAIPVDLPEGQADAYHLELASGEVLPTGVYYLSVDAPENNQDNRWWQNQRNFIIVADTNLIVKEMYDEVHVWATDLASGQPASDLELTLYSRTGGNAGTATTDENGLATFAYKQPEQWLDGVLVVAGEPAQPRFGVASSTWNQGVSPYNFGVNANLSSEPDRYAYLYTDRPIYRPGDTIHFKGIVRDTNYGRYPLPTNEQITLALRFLNDYSDVDFEFTADVDANGEFSGEYAIPANAALGNYQFWFRDQDLGQDDRSTRTFAVAEYRKPEFQVTVTPSEDQALRGDTVEVLVEATFFAGGAASDLAVNWTFYEKSFRPSFEGPYYSFGDDGDFYYQPPGPFQFGGQGVYGNYLIGGSGTTDANGQLVIELPADLLDEADPGSREVTVQVDVMDISNFPITSRTSVVFHAAELYVGLRSDDYLTTAGTSATVDLVTVDWDGQPVADQDVQVIIYEREWQPVRDEQFNQRYTRWEAIDTEVERQSIITDRQGEAQIEFVPEAGGTYVVTAEVTDGGGRSQLSSLNLWVIDENYAGWPSDPYEKRMDLVADMDEYEPGDVARILVQSPFEGPAEAWLTIERGTLIEQRIVTLESATDVLEIPISTNYAPNVFVTVHVVKGIDETNEFADMRIGVVELVVSPQHLALNLSITPQQEQLEPGDTAVFDLQVTNLDGDPVQTNLSVALVDLAVLSLKADNAPDIVEGFYSRQPLRSQTGAGLVITGEGREIEIPLEQLGMGGGGGEGEAVSAYRLPGEDEDVRRDFPDTAYWNAQVATDANGQATIEIPLPDSVTTWRMSSKGVSLYEATNDTLVGQNSADILATLPLFIRPVTPRFFTVGDSLQLGAVVHNNTGQEQEVTVSLEAAGLTLFGPAEQTVTIADGAREMVQWPVTVDDVPFADLTFRAKAGEFSDATKPTFGIPPDQLVQVVRYAGEDVVGTSGVLDVAGQRVEAILLPPDVDERQGEVQVNLSPSLAAAMTQALDYVDNQAQQIVCASSAVNQLLPNVAVELAMQKLDLPGAQTPGQNELVTVPIAKLESLQLRGGGWGWCYSEEVDRWLTAYAMLGLVKAQQAGYEVSAKTMESGTRALSGFVGDAAELTERSEVNAQAFYLYVLSELDQVDVADLDALFDTHRGLMDAYAKGLLISAYDLAGGDGSKQQALLADLNNSVVVSATGAHWEDVEQDWENLSSDIRGTAMIVDGLTRLAADNPMVANAVRWLMVARTAGHWDTSQEDAWSIMALTNYMVATGELNADYTYQVGINGAMLDSGQFNESNVTENKDLTVPVGNLVLDDVNFLAFERGAGDGRLYYTAHLDSYIRAETLEPVDRGVIVQRAYYDAACDPAETECEPISQIAAGQQVRVELTIIAPHDLVYAVIKDPIPSGAEGIDPGLETTSGTAGPTFQRADVDPSYDYWGWWYFNRVEFRDESVVFYSEFLPAGTYKYTYNLQTVIPGEYQVIPATAREDFFPEVFGRSDGFLFTIE